MKLNSEITPESYRKLSRILSKSRASQRQSFYIGLIIILILIMPWAISIYFTASLSLGVAFEFFILFIIVIIVLFCNNYMKIVSGQFGNANYGIWSFEIEDTGLRVINIDHFNKLYLYNAFVDVYVKNDLLIILLGPCNGLHIQISDMNRAQIPEFLDALKKNIGVD